MINRRVFLAVATALGLAAFGATSLAQGPVKVGMSMPQTGPLGAGGKAALLALQIWVDDVNKKGGLLGRKVDFIVYDDQTNPALTPSIYTKLLDVDKVDLLIAPYGTVPTAPIMPLVKQRGLLLIGNFSFQVNRAVRHDMWFNNSPWNDARSWSTGFFEAADKLGAAKTIAFLAADQEFAQNLANGAKQIAKSKDLKIVYEQNYPPATVDFSSMIRAIRAAKPDIVYVMSYPNDSVAIIRAVNEIGVGPQVKLFGGGMVGLQFTPIMESLGSLLNGVVNYNSYVPGVKYPGVEEFLKRYSERAVKEKVDPLGFYLPPFNYAIGQILEQAVTATKSLDHKTLAAWLHKNEVQTIVGPIRWDANGEWENPRVIMAQFRGVADKNIDQFRQPGKQVVLYPPQFKTGEVMGPFEKVRK
ncbi:MAG TPA: amino acid ABC transporter substrate-binding protein [Burkholderiales bacterium]|jgi:branched-chain amino acid transport system substrate-binding protein|nr:amino acid ABC transporter substrate-binding protein [Burkholderiales bacterium]